MKKLFLYIIIFLLVFSCGQKTTIDDHKEHTTVTTSYTCPMHPEIVRSEPGDCPICGMALVKKTTQHTDVSGVDLKTVLLPVNGFTISSIPVTSIKEEELAVTIETTGTVAYDPRKTGNISARISGRIEKLYITHRYQLITKGQRIMDIYSPELLTEQQNLIFLLQNDPGNTTLVNAAKQRLLFLGLTPDQVTSITKTGKVFLKLPVYSNYSGHIHEAGTNLAMSEKTSSLMGEITQTTGELRIKEGAYIKKGDVIFTVSDPKKAWVVINIYERDLPFIKAGDAVNIAAEAGSGSGYRARLDFIDPFFRTGSKTVTARAIFNNSALLLPVGSKVHVKIFSSGKKGSWLPKQAVSDLGSNKIVFVKEQNGFKVRTIKTGVINQDKIEVISGLAKTDSVAINAQYLADSESFLKQRQ